MSLQIVAISGPLTGRTFPLSNTPLSLGRTPDNTVVIASALASRRHAELRYEGNGYVLYDLGSSNGTSVNGQRVQTARLNPGDVITIGDESFRFDAPAIDKTLLASGTPPPPAFGVQTPLPPVVSAPGYGLPHPAMSASSRPNSRKPVMIVVGLLLACAVVAGLGGGALLITRMSSGGLPLITTSTAGSQGVTAPVPSRVPTTGQDAAWTVMVYLDGDNNLEADALTDFAEMSKVGSSDRIKIVVQLDRVTSRESWDDTRQETGRPQSVSWWARICGPRQRTRWTILANRIWATRPCWPILWSGG